jgi:hypothetical protein
MAVIQGIRGRPWRTFARDKSEGVGKAYNAGRAARPFAAVVAPWDVLCPTRANHPVRDERDFRDVSDRDGSDTR